MLSVLDVYEWDPMHVDVDVLPLAKNEWNYSDFIIFLNVIDLKPFHGQGWNVCYILREIYHVRNLKEMAHVQLGFVRSKWSNSNWPFWNVFKYLLMFS